MLVRFPDDFPVLELTRLVTEKGYEIRWWRSKVMEEPLGQVIRQEHREIPVEESFQ